MRSRRVRPVDDPDSQIARARMALVYGSQTTDLFFGLLKGHFASDVPYDHSQIELEKAIRDAAPGIAYDDFRKRLSFAGVLSGAARDALEALPGTPAGFLAAVQRLFDENQKVLRPLFGRHPELKDLHDQFFASNEPEENRRKKLLESVLPELVRHRKRQQAAQAISAAAATDVEFGRAVLDAKPEFSTPPFNQVAPVFVMHAAGDSGRPALDDLTGAETRGLSAQFFFRATARCDRCEPEPATCLAYAAI